MISFSGQTHQALDADQRATVEHRAMQLWLLFRQTLLEAKQMLVAIDSANGLSAVLANDFRRNILQRNAWLQPSGWPYGDLNTAETRQSLAGTLSVSVGTVNSDLSTLATEITTLHGQINTLIDAAVSSHGALYSKDDGPVYLNTTETATIKTQLQAIESLFESG